MKSAARAAVLFSLASLTGASLTGCATVMDGHTQAVSVQTLKNDVIPVEGSCVVSNKQGSWTINTPGTVSVDRGRGNLNLACTAPGYRPEIISVAAAHNQDEGGNMLLGGGVGIIVDYSDGAAYQYPGEIDVPMQLAAPPAPVAAVPSAPAARTS
jgi:hypothetical protein